MTATRECVRELRRTRRPLCHRCVRAACWFLIAQWRAEKPNAGRRTENFIIHQVWIKNVIPKRDRERGGEYARVIAASSGT